jgi:hypothetical protein
MAVAIQPAMPPRPTTDSPVTIAAARPPQPKRRMSGKENLPQGKPTSSSAVASVRNRRERPCDACRRRKSRCVIHEGAVLCVLCEFHKQECTFVQDPQPRKRKVTGDADKQREGGSPKKRYALTWMQGVLATCKSGLHTRIFTACTCSLSSC